MMVRSILALAIALLASNVGRAQSTQTPLLVTRIPGVTSAWAGEGTGCPGTVSNVSSVSRANTYHAVSAVGTGSWTVTIRYSNTACTGPWTSYGTTGAIDQSTSVPVAFGIDPYNVPAKYVNILITGNAIAVYSGEKQLFLSTSIGAITFPCTIGQGCTGATTATGGANNLQVIRAETGAAARTYTSKFGDVLTGEDFGALGNDATNDTTALTNAFAAVAGTQKTLRLCGTYRISSDMVLASSISLDGCGTGIIKRVASTGTVNALYIAGADPGILTSVTADVNGDFAGRATSTALTISVASTTGIVAGTWLKLIYNASATRYFQQMVRVKSVSSLDLTLHEAVKIPMDSAQSNTVEVVTPITGIRIRNITFDGSLITGSANGGGLQVARYAYGTFDNVTFQNYPIGSGVNTDISALQTFTGYGNTWRDSRAINAGRHNGDLWFNAETQLRLDGVRSDNTNPSNTDSSGLTIQASTNTQVFNFQTSGHTLRCHRSIMNAWIQYTNYQADSCGANGMFITWDTYQVQMNNVHINRAINTSAIAIGGGDESYIWINGWAGYNNGGPGATRDLGLFASVHDVWVNGYSATGAGSFYETANPNLPPNALVNIANGTQSIASIGCTGVATSSTTLYLAVSPPTACTSATLDNRIYITAPLAGVLRNLRVVAAVGGVNASSGLVSVVLSGTGTILSCTLGANLPGATCSDTTNAARVPAGAILYVTVTTQAAEILAGINVSFEY